MAGPLQGIQVVEFTEIIAAPLAGMLLSDMGAQVIKVEPPWGDPWRSAQAFTPTESRQFHAYNRGKRGLTLDLTSPESQEVVRRLVTRADVVLVNYRPDVAEKLGVDYPSLSSINPRIIYCENTAFGRKGPDAQRPGYDIIIQAMSGLMAAEGKVQDGAPLHIWSSPLVDTTAGLVIAWTVCGALFHRERTGKGQMIETTLMGTAINLLGSRVSQVDSLDKANREELVTSLDALREAGLPYEDIQEVYQEQHPPTSGTMYYRTYATSNGAIAVGCLSDPLRKRLLEALHLEDIRFKPGYNPQSAEALASDAQLIDKSRRIFRTRTTEEWLTLMEEKGVPAGPVRFPEELFRDPQVLANHMLTDVEHKEVGKITMAGPLADFSETPLSASPPPALGQHSEEILLELGFAPSQVQNLRESGTVA